MKTVEERVAEVDKMAILPVEWHEVMAEVAKQLTQQAAEWQIEVNETNKATVDRVRTALKAELAAEKLRGAQAVAMERQNWEAYRAGEAARIEQAVAKAHEHAAHALDVDGRPAAALLVRGLAKACPAGEPEPPLWRAKFGVGGRAKQFYFIDEYGNPHTPPGLDPVKPRPGSLLDEVVEKLRKLEARLDAIQKPG